MLDRGPEEDEETAQEAPEIRIRPAEQQEEEQQAIIDAAKTIVAVHKKYLLCIYQ